MKNGRPTKYNEEIATKICEAISCSSKGLRILCKENIDFPNPDTIFTWLTKYESFSERYTLAKKHQVNSLVDEILEIADDSSGDTTIRIDEEGNEKEICNSEWINRSRLRVDTRKWIAARLAPKLYGDKSTQDHNVNVKAEDRLKDLE